MSELEGREVAGMDWSVFTKMQEACDQVGRDISVAFEKLGSDFNRSNSSAQRKETAGKTGIIRRGESCAVTREEEAASVCGYTDTGSLDIPANRAVEVKREGLAPRVDDVAGNICQAGVYGLLLV